MNALYRTLGISKQSFHQQMIRYLSCRQEEEQLLMVVRDIRKEHPALSARQMYFMIKPVRIGRDKFEALCFRHGFKMSRKRSFQRTTNSLGVTRFENLLKGIELISINQVWVSDITYYRIDESFYYLTFIMDLYSRFIIGYSASINLFTESTTIPALKMALRERQITNGSGLVLHSDGGGQYYSKEFLKITASHRILNSMAETVYENSAAERINGTIKNDYLIHYNPRCFKSLKKALVRAVNNYNLRPHSSHKRISPYQLEKRIINRC